MSRSIPEYYNIYAFISVYKLMLYLLEDIIYNIFIYMFVWTLYLHLLNRRNLSIPGYYFSCLLIYNLQSTTFKSYNLFRFYSERDCKRYFKWKRVAYPIHNGTLETFLSSSILKTSFFLALKCLILTISSFVSEAELRKYF